MAGKESSSFSKAPEILLREALKRDLLTFPEAAALDASQLEEAVERVIMESNPSTATRTAPGMVRLSDDRIATFFSDGSQFPSIHDPPPGGVFPTDWIYDQQKKLDDEVQPHKKTAAGHSEELLLAMIRVDLLTKGYVDVPALYMEDSPEQLAALTEAAARNYRRELPGFAGPDDEKWWRDEAALKRMILESD